MPVQIGEVEALFRYPVKSMGGEPLQQAELGWYGIPGDRRLALRRTEDRGDFPVLSASSLPDMVRFTPLRQGTGNQADLPTHIRTPEGLDLAVFGEELAAEIGRRLGSPVQMMQLRHGIFDETPLSVITTGTVAEVARLAAQSPDVRRFRPNILVRGLRSVPFEEDEWVGGVLSFGEGSEAAAAFVTMRDERCSMVNFDPDSARPAPEVLKAIVRERQNKAGVYGTVLRCGKLSVGQPIFFTPATGKDESR